MQNKEEFMEEYRYIKNLIKKLNSVAEILNIDSDEPFGPIIDHHVKLLAKAFNIPENNIDILWDMLNTGYVQIAVYNDNNQLCKIIPVTETNLYEELIGTKNAE